MQMNESITPSPEEVAEYFFQMGATPLCPYRKVTYAYTTNPKGEGKLITGMQHAEWTEEEFLPCLKEQCAAHAYESTIHGNYALHYCTLLNNRLL